ncbi:MAG: DUF7933 domain-containing protein, partial [Anaerolineae bacterium]
MKAKSKLSLQAVFSLLIVVTLIFGAVLPAQVLAASTLSITPITWNVIGLDSNNPPVGPHVFPVGARVCSSSATTSVQVSFIWDSNNPYIQLLAGSLQTITIPSLAAGACYDAYFQVDVTQTASAYNTTRRYYITATDDSGSVSTPTPRELYIEHLISQNRNTTTSIKVNGVAVIPGNPAILVVGQTYTVTLDASTATQGYSQIETFINMPNNFFQVLSVTTSYTADNSPYVPNPNDKLYADACRWENDPNSPNYRSCVGGDYKAGGSVITTYRVKIISGSGSTVAINPLIYDFSGSSYHYNADFYQAWLVSIIDPTSGTISKSFNPSTTSVNGVSALTIILGNPNTGTLSGYAFIDTLPANMTVANPPAATTIGCGTPTFAPTAGATSLSFTNGTLAANSTCIIVVNVTITAAATYTNTSQHLFIGTLDTGKTATAILTATNALELPPCTPGLKLASWTMETSQGVTIPPVYSFKSGRVSSAVSSFNNGTSLIYTGPILGSQPLNYWGATGWSVSSGAPITSTSPSFQFTVDTSQFSNVQIAFKAIAEGGWASQNNGMYVYSSADGGGFTSIYADSSGFPKTVWTSFGPHTATTTGSSSTAFRIISAGVANNPSSTPYAYLDDINITGCGVPMPPAITKAFATNPVAVNGTSTLQFTLTNENNITLTGVAFNDVLPTGLIVASPPNVSTTCGSPTWFPITGSTVLSFTGGTIPAQVGTTNGTCTVRVDVKATTAGQHLNVTGYISSTLTGANTSANGSASASLTAIQPPNIAKEFAPNPILSGGISTLTFIVTNPNQNNVLSGVAFTDSLPTSPGSMVVATTPNPSTSGCGTPTFAPAAGATSITFTGGTITGGGTCIVKVNVTAPTAGTYSNHSGIVSTIINSQTISGNTASASLTVRAPIPAIGVYKQVSTSASGPWSTFQALPEGGSVYFRFTVENIGDVPLSSINVSDTILAGTTADPSTCTWTNPLPVASPTQDPTETCIKGPITAASGLYTNTAVAYGTYNSIVYTSTPSFAEYATTGLALTKIVTESYYTTTGSLLHYSYIVTNTGSAPLASPVTVVDNKATTVVCPSLTTVGDLDLFLDPDESIICSAIYTVTAGDVTALSVTNAATATVSGVTSNQASASVVLVNTEVEPNLIIGKLFVPRQALPGDQVQIQLRITNTGQTAAFGVSLDDLLPTDLINPSAGSLPNGFGYSFIPASTVRFSGGTIAASESVTIVFTATLASTLQQGAILHNVVTITQYLSLPPETPGGRTYTGTSAFDDLTVILPDLSISKTDGLVVAVPGQVLTYSLTISNTGTRAATTMLITDTLPDHTAFVSASNGGSYNPGTRQVTWSLPGLAIGAQRVLTYQVTLDSPWPANTPRITNTAVISDATYPDPTPADNSTRDVDEVWAPTMSKTLLGSDLGLLPKLTVGEIATYRVVITIPQASAANARFFDLLPDGMALVNFVSLTPSAAIQTSHSGGWSGVLADVITASGGVSFTLPFDTITNTDTNDSVAETITVTYRAVVLNTSANLRGTALTNTATFASQFGSLSASTTVSLAEPAMSLTKTVTPLSGDAGDMVTFTLTIQHAAASDGVAYDVLLTDIVPVGLTYVPGSLSTISGLAPATITQAAPDLSMAWSQYPLGSQTILTFRATLDQDVQPFQMILNQVRLTWTSLPGAVQSPRSTANPLSCERTGNSGDCGQLNNYAANAQAGVGVIGTYNVTKALVSSSHPGTQDPSATIGEIITYSLSISLSEGLFNGLVVTDVLPYGLGWVPASLSIDTTGFAGSVSAPIIATAASSGDDIGFTFNQLTVTGDNIATNNTFTLSFQVRVLDILGPNNGDVLSNSATIALPGGPITTSNVITTNILEPRLVIDKQIVPDQASPGDQVLVRLVITNTGTTNAYDITVNDPLPVGMTKPLAVSTPAGFAYSEPVTGTVRYTGGPLAPNQAAVFTYSVTLANSLTPGTVLTNVATIQEYST